MVDLEQLLPALNKAGVELIIVGGVAAIVHGSARLTRDAGRPKDLEVIAELEALREE
jgi:hypothetical protein